MTEVHAGVPEGDARKRRSEQHLPLRFGVARVASDAREMLNRLAHRPQAEDVRDWVRALIPARE